MSGLLVCAECGHNYRRITRPSGEIVWRCASRVEHGKKVLSAFAFHIGGQDQECSL
nr:zinc ribbon domain-containing protein [Flintibacter hominis]